MPIKIDQFQKARIDRSALMLMLNYIEAECQNLGAADSARHIALAAALLTDETAESQEPSRTLMHAPGAGNA